MFWRCKVLFYDSWTYFRWITNQTIQEKVGRWINIGLETCLWTHCLNTYYLDYWFNLIFRLPGWKWHMDRTKTEYMNYNSLRQNNFVLNTYMYFRFRRWSPTFEGNRKFGSIYSHLNTLVLQYNISRKRKCQYIF